MEAVNCKIIVSKIKLASNKFILINVYANSNFDVEIWIIETLHSKFVLLVMLNISQIPEKLHLAERFVQKSDDSKYCNFLNSKLRREYISASFTKFSEHSCL